MFFRLRTLTPFTWIIALVATQSSWAQIPDSVVEMGRTSVNSTSLSFDYPCEKFDTDFILSQDNTSATLNIDTVRDGILRIPVFVQIEGAGLNLQIGIRRSCKASLNGVTGMASNHQVSSLFGTFYGVRVGAELGLGGSALIASNSQGVWMGDLTARGFFGIDLSLLRVRILPRDVNFLESPAANLILE